MQYHLSPATIVNQRWQAVGTLTLVYSTAERTGIPPRRYDIAPGLLGDVLDAWQTRSGVHVSTPVAGIRELHSPGATGFFTSQSAIEQILKNTGLAYRFTGQKAVILEAAAL